MALGHRVVETNGIRMHFAEEGTGRLVVLCHGFPESWYSWRHQLPVLAAAGYHAVAPDMRGYGGTDRPDEIDKYTVLHLVGDLVGLVHALGERDAVIVGHDWGAAVAWTAARLRPDVFRTVVALSVPYTPRGTVPPTVALKQAVGDQFMYQLYFQTPGLAEAELERDVEATLRRVLYSASGDAPADQAWKPVAKQRSTLFDTTTDPQTLPRWLTQADLDFYAGEFRRTGFRGGLNWYRNLDRNWELTAAFDGVAIGVPALFMIGDRDGVLAMRRHAVDHLRETVPTLRDTIVMPGCGHWIQQERPRQVNDALVAFLETLRTAAAA